MLRSTTIPAGRNIREAGAANALANYWLTRFEYEDTGETTAVPECNLADSCSVPFYDWIRRKGAGADKASLAGGSFAAGVAIGAILAGKPLGCDRELREVLEDFLRDNSSALAENESNG